MNKADTTHGEKPLSVCIRGAGGLLGHRLFRMMGQQKDMEVSTVVLNGDPRSFKRFRRTALAMQEQGRLHPDLNLLIDGKRKAVSALMSDWHGPWNILPLDQGHRQLREADAIVDTSLVTGRDSLQDFYRSYGKPVVFQSGTYPSHRTVAPPFEPERSSPLLFRQGDCLLSGIAPVLYAFREKLQSVLAVLFVQKQERLNDYTLRANLDELLINPALNRMILSNLAEVMPELGEEHIRVKTVQSPAHDYYLCECDLHLTEEMSHEQVVNALAQQPRVAVLRDPLEKRISTADLQNHIREAHEENDLPLQPIVCFGNPEQMEIQNQCLTLRFAIYSKAITGLPNIDAVRALCKDMPMLESMRVTDAYCGFRSKVLT